MSSQLARFSSFHVPLTKSQQEPSPPVHVDISNIAVLRNALLCFHFFDPFEKGVLDLDNAHRILSNAKSEALVELLKEVLEICRGCLEKKEFVLTLYGAIEAGFCTDLKGKDNVVADYFKGLGVRIQAMYTLNLGFNRALKYCELQVLSKEYSFGEEERVHKE